MTESGWLAQLLEGNALFRHKAKLDRLPVARTPGRFALVTCMDPRINPAALGIAAFGVDGSGSSDVRIIRTIGAMAEERSLIVAIHLAGVREIALVTHTDCGNGLAKQKIDKLSANLRDSVTPAAYRAVRHAIGEPFEPNLVAHLKAFDDPQTAVEQEVAAVRRNPFVPADIILHGLVYHLDTAELEVVVDGYAEVRG